MGNSWSSKKKKKNPYDVVWTYGCVFWVALFGFGFNYEFTGVIVLCGSCLLSLVCSYLLVWNSNDSLFLPSVCEQIILTMVVILMTWLSSSGAHHLVMESSDEMNYLWKIHIPRNISMGNSYWCFGIIWRLDHGYWFISAFQIQWKALLLYKGFSLHCFEGS